jgi:hypothetical protein
MAISNTDSVLLRAQLLAISSVEVQGTGGFTNVSQYCIHDYGIVVATYYFAMEAARHLGIEEQALRDVLNNGSLIEGRFTVSEKESGKVQVVKVGPHFFRFFNRAGDFLKVTAAQVKRSAISKVPIKGYDVSIIVVEKDRLVDATYEPILEEGGPSFKVLPSFLEEVEIPEKKACLKRAAQRREPPGPTKCPRATVHARPCFDPNFERNAAFAAYRAELQKAMGESTEKEASPAKEAVREEVTRAEAIAGLLLISGL